MKNENMNVIEVKAEDFGLEQSKGKEIELAFAPSIEQLNELKPEYDLLVQKEISEEVASEAKELRLRFVKVRTDTGRIHKVMKAFYLAGGRFVDAWKNKQLEISNQVEDRLKEIETHFERIEFAKKEKRKLLRLNQLGKIEHSGEGIDLLNMEDATWNAVIKGLEVEYKEAKERQKKEEAARIAKEKADAKERQRINLENERLKKEAAEKEKTLKAEREKVEADKKQAELKAKKEREAQERKAKAEKDAALAEERKKQEAKLAEQKALAEKERKIADEKARKAKEESDKKAAEERKKLEAKILKEKKARQKIEEILNSGITCPHCNKHINLEV